MSDLGKKAQYRFKVFGEYSAETINGENVQFSVIDLSPDYREDGAIAVCRNGERECDADADGVLSGGVTELLDSLDKPSELAETIYRWSARKWCIIDIHGRNWNIYTYPPEITERNDRLVVCLLFEPDGEDHWAYSNENIHYLTAPPCPEADISEWVSPPLRRWVLSLPPRELLRVDAYLRSQAAVLTRSV